jgi:hypothetical protein
VVTAIRGRAGRIAAGTDIERNADSNTVRSLGPGLTRFSDGSDLDRAAHRCDNAADGAADGAADVPAHGQAHSQADRHTHLQALGHRDADGHPDTLRDSQLHDFHNSMPEPVTTVTG